MTLNIERISSQCGSTFCRTFASVLRRVDDNFIGAKLATYGYLPPAPLGVVCFGNNPISLHLPNVCYLCRLPTAEQIVIEQTMIPSWGRMHKDNEEKFITGIIKEVAQPTRYLRAINRRSSCITGTWRRIGT